MQHDLISDRARALGLRTLKRAAGAVTRLVPITPPVLLVGPGSALRLGQAVAGFGHRRVLLVTDAVITQLGLAAPLAEALAAAGVQVVVFDGVTPDAPIPVVEQGLALFVAEKCEAIVAFGGGSVMDAAKVIGLAAANGKHPRELVGYFKGRHGPAPLYAVPTTAGTGSEVTVAAIISDPDAGQKMMVADSRLVPEMAALDPTLMTGLPPAITAATGMDALTHAVEAFISLWATPYTDRMALAAARMIWQQLPRAWQDGSDLDAREQMALASTYAGLAFTRANVGNVHAIAHQLGGRYHTPHGLANAIMLASVLRFSLPDAAPRLARLARHVGLAGKTELALAKKFVDAVQALNDALEIPRTLAALREEDLEALAAAACHEADFNYPVPRRMTPADCTALLRLVLSPTAQPAKAPAKRRAQRRPAASSKAVKASRSTK
ncbi:MAG: iron-containing alcohol dehydrogenase [Rubrivivax sp.]|nr:iron-containing alcohol dehydrogenase [Rubrivivax sp.]